MAKTFERNVKGLLGTKLGMTQLWDENNKVVPVTVIAASTNVVTQIRQPEVDGYNAIQVGFGEIEARKVNSPDAGHFAKAGVTPRRHVVEIRTADAAAYTVGQELGVETFAAGEEIDVTGTSKGKGFAGVMKRHGFHGVSASHGAHRNHRKPGSIGACATPGRVFKGTRMAGRMGNDTVTTQNLTVHAVAGAQTVEAVPLHDTGGALALAGGGHVDDDAGVEDLVGGDFLADLVPGDVIGAQFGQMPTRGDAGLGEVAGLRLVHLARIDGAERELDGAVAVLLGRADRRDDNWTGGHDGDRHDPVVGVENLGHPELVAQDSLHGIRHD
jgi:large subunit ribosomal protein L3